MKKILLGIIALGAFLLGVLAQSPNKRGEASLSIDGGRVSIDYGSPTLKGRDIESLIAPGEEWRMGADAATTLSTDVSLKFGNKVVSKGKYVLRAKLVAKEKWHLLIQKEDKSTVVEVPLTYQKSDNPVEELTIKLEKQGSGGKFILEWGKFSLSTEFQKT
ncbi:MAG: hypothetical protein DMG06_07550 [Acidobacteria bacterium]|nr:MAG: hypothetical protein DMG06_07550 [Acidobacteriota bacterium]